MFAVQIIVNDPVLLAHRAAASALTGTGTGASWSSRHRRCASAIADGTAADPADEDAAAAALWAWLREAAAAVADGMDAEACAEVRVGVVASVFAIDAVTGAVVCVRCEWIGASESFRALLLNSAQILLTIR